MSAAFRYLALGAASGLRSMAAPSQLSRHLDAPVRGLLRAAAAGEMIVDKLPVVPDRTDPGPLVGRALLGAGSAAVLARSRRETPARGALLGGVGAVAGAFAGFHLRRALTRRAGLPDLAVAVCEDAIAVAAARLACRD